MNSFIFTFFCQKNRYQIICILFISICITGLTAANQVALAGIVAYVPVSNAYAKYLDKVAALGEENVEEFDLKKTLKEFQSHAIFIRRFIQGLFQVSFRKIYEAIAVWYFPSRFADKLTKVP
jgi:hypothetical protein